MNAYCRTLQTNACILQDIARYETVMLSTIQQPSICLHFLRPGRLVRIREGHLDWGWGIVVSVMRKAVAVNAAIDTEDMGPASAYVLDLLLSCDATSVKGQSQHLVMHNGVLFGLRTSSQTHPTDSLNDVDANWINNMSGTA
jgi:hypothetical protein